MLSTVFSPSGLFSLKRSGSDDRDAHTVSAFFLASPSPAPTSTASNILMESQHMAPASSSGVPSSSSSLFSPLQMHAFAQQQTMETSSSTPMMMQHSSSSIPMPMDHAQSEPQQQPQPTLRFTAGPSAAASASSIGAFNFAAAAAPVKQVEFIVDIPCASMFQRSTSAPHHNPELLEGFLLDGGCAAPAAAVAAPASTEGKRKRKETSAPSSASSEELSTDSASKKARRHGKSLNDSRSSSPSVSSSSSSSAAETLAHKSSSSSSSGATSPLLELLQQSNQSLSISAPEANAAKVKGAANKKERAELRRHKAAMKLLRLEASIARLTAEVTQTKAQEQAATALAEEMARQAQEAAHFASMHVAATAAAAAHAQRQEEAAGRMIDSFLVGDSSDESATLSIAGGAIGSSSDLSLPPLSPVALTAMAPHSLRIGVTSMDSSEASLSSCSVSEDVDLSECSTPTDAVASRLLGTSASAVSTGSRGSPVQSLDDAIDAAMMQAQSAGVSTEELVAHVQGLAWAEQARSIRAVQYALSAALDNEPASGCFGSADLALRFAESEAGLCCGAGAPAVRSALESLHAECAAGSESDVESTGAAAASDVELHHTLRAFTSAFLAKQRACAVRA